MPDSVVEQLRSDVECEALLECVHGMKDLDRELFQALVDSGDALTVDELAERVERERSTAYRGVQRLLQAGFVRKEQVNYEQGGYYHVYRPADPDAVADDMQRLLDEWHAQMGQLIQEFRDEYGERVEQPAVQDSVAQD